jgi:hypothetical protein
VNDPDLEAFVRSSIRSVWALELLLALRAAPERAWSVDELVRELRGSPTLAADALEALQAGGLVARHEDGRVAYAPVSSVVAGFADQLAALYRERPGRVIRAIVSSPRDKLQSFADAFRFKEDKDR